MDEQQEIELLNEELLARQRHPREPVRIREVLSQLMSRRGYGQSNSNKQKQQAWRQACGEPLGAHSRAGNLNRGTLTVFVRNSMVLQELTFQQHEIIQRLAEIYPDLKVKALRMRVGVIE